MDHPITLPNKRNGCWSFLPYETLDETLRNPDKDAEEVIFEKQNEAFLAKLTWKNKNETANQSKSK